MVSLVDTIISRSILRRFAALIVSVSSLLILSACPFKTKLEVSFQQGAISNPSIVRVLPVSPKEGDTVSLSGNNFFPAGGLKGRVVFSDNTEADVTLSIASATSATFVIRNTRGLTLKKIQMLRGQAVVASYDMTSPVANDDGGTTGSTASTTGTAAATTVETPTFNPAGGSYNSARSVTLSTATNDARIYYTVDGSTPTTSSTLYSTAITVSSTQTIKAYAVKANYTASSVASAVYTINGAVATPTFSVASGTYNSTQSVTLMTTTSGATIYYTLDNSTPTISSTVYATPILVTSTQTIKALAIKSNYTDSAIGIATYTISTPPVAPTGVTAVTSSSSSNTISWSTVAGATSYNIYWNTTGSPTTASTKISAVTSPYSHTGLSMSTTYYYAVTASNAGGESVISNIVSATPGPIYRVLNGSVDLIFGQDAVASDHYGNVYYANSRWGTCIKKYNMTSATTTTIAGTCGTYGYSGDGGAATSALLQNIGGIAVSYDGEVFFTHYTDHVVGKISVSGTISTIINIGSSLSGITLDSKKNIFVGDVDTSTPSVDHSFVRKFTYSSGSWSYTSTFYNIQSPGMMAVDANDNVYVVLKSGNPNAGSGVQKITPAGGSTLIAGDLVNASSSSGDGGLASSAKFKYVETLAVDAKGHIYIGDTEAYRIRKIDAFTNIITTYAGNATGTLSDGANALSGQLAASGIFFDQSGRLTAWQTTKFVSIDSPPSIVSTPTWSSSLAGAQAMTHDTQGNMYVSLAGSYCVKKVAVVSRVITTYAGDCGTSGSTGDGSAATSAKLTDVYGLAVASNGDLYISTYDDSRIRKVTAATGNISTLISTGLSYPMGIAMASNGDLYIADNGNVAVKKVASGTSTLTNFAGTGALGFSGDGGVATMAKLQNPTNVAVDASGNVYIVDSQNYRIRKVDFTTHVISTIAGIGTLGFSGDGGAATSAAIKPYVGSLNGIIVDRFGNIYYADRNNQRIRKIDTSGIMSTFAGNGTFDESGSGVLATAVGFGDPLAISMDSWGRLYVNGSSGLMEIN